MTERKVILHSPLDAELAGQGDVPDLVSDADMKAFYERTKDDDLDPSRSTGLLAYPGYVERLRRLYKQGGKLGMLILDIQAEYRPVPTEVRPQLVSDIGE
jgi:hypothetical protein